MTRFRLLLKNLLYFRGVNLSVMLGMAVATAVLTGALLVGDSVRGSLRELALQRLGSVDEALIATRFFDASLGARMQSDHRQIAPATIVRGGGASNDATGLHTAGVQIAALDASHPLPGDWPAPPAGSVIINGELADALGVKSAGESIVLSVPIASDTPRDAVLSHRSRSDTINGLRVQVSGIDRGASFSALFNPAGGQRVPRNAWVNLADLQQALEQPGRVNALLVHETAETSSTAAMDELNGSLAHALTLDDAGLTTAPALGGTMVSIGSRTIYLSRAVLDAAEKAGAQTKTPVQKISVNLINSLTRAGESSTRPTMLHYVIAAGVDPLESDHLGPNDMAINQWTADALGAKAGDQLTIDFRARQSGGELIDASKIVAPAALTFRVTRILPMAGIGVDPALAPNYKGLTDANSIADWNPPEGLDIDKSLVTKADEAYWNEHRAAPKIFVSFDTAISLWGGAYGGITGLRVPAVSSDAFLTALCAELAPASMGFIFQPMRAQQLAAATGGTDFSEYFLYFSFFLIVSAVLLVAMLFRLNIEQRARQMGLLAAVGFAPARLRRMALAEGMLLALVGALVGLGGAIGYTALIMAGLRTWWVGAVGTTAMHLHVEPMTLASGFVVSLLVAFFAILWGVWDVGRVAAARLLAGSWQSRTGRKRSGIITRWVGIAGIVLSLATLAMAAFKFMAADEAFLTGGGLLLCSCLIWLAGALRPRAHRTVGFVGAGSVFRLGARNSARHTGRSVLAIGLIAFAVFTLIVVAVMRQGGPSNLDQRQSGTGGYQLIVQAGIPLLGDLNTPAGRKLLGIREPDAPIWSRATFTPMRSWAGQDISCLNLTRPTTPTILSVPAAMVERNAFTTAGNVEKIKDKSIWTLLAQTSASDIPVIADDETAQYVLQLPIGGTLPIVDQQGRPRNLRLVGTIEGSIFQSELLMGEGNFLSLFPAQSGAGVVLVDCPAGDADELSRRLASELDEYAVSVDTTAGRLATYRTVANTYLATFQTLGSLGLLLGTVGLAVVLIRTVIERRSELALLASIGFPPGDRVRLILAENASLLLIGLLVGGGSALIGVAPALIGTGRSLNLTGLVVTLAAVVIVGLGTSVLAVMVSGLRVAPSDLRRE